MAPRIQIAVERLKLQQEQVSRTAPPLEDLRREMDNRRDTQPRLQQRLQSLENLGSREVDPSHRRDFEEASKKRQARNRLASQLQSEQSKLTELNDHLDQMERALKCTVNREVSVTISPMPKFKMDRSILEAALVGLGHKMGEVTHTIAEIKRMLGRGAAAGAQTQGTRRHMSAASRAKIAAAQRKRWAAQKKQKGQATAPAKKTVPKKRKISADARKRMADTTRKRWAEYRAKKAKAAKT